MLIRITAGSPVSKRIATYVLYGGKLLAIDLGEYIPSPGTYVAGTFVGYTIEETRLFADKVNNMARLSQRMIDAHNGQFAVTVEEIDGPIPDWAQ